MTKRYCGPMRLVWDTLMWIRDDQRNKLDDEYIALKNVTLI